MSQDMSHDPVKPVWRAGRAEAGTGSGDGATPLGDAIPVLGSPAASPRVASAAPSAAETTAEIFLQAALAALAEAEEKATAPRRGVSADDEATAEAIAETAEEAIDGAPDGAAAGRAAEVDEPPVAPAKKRRQLPDGWAKRLVTAVLAVAVVVGAGVAFGRLPSPQPEPAVPGVATHVDLTCPAAGGLAGTVTGLAGDNASWQPAGGAAQTVAGPVFQQPVSGAAVLAGDGSLAGLAQFSREGQAAAVACAQPLASGYLQTASADAVLVLTNIDSAEAVLNIALLGPSGEIAAPDLIDLRVAAGATKEISLHDYAAGVAPLGLRWQSTVGRVVAWVRVDAAAGLDLVAPSKAGEGVVIAGVPAGAAVNLLLTNPAATRVKAQVGALTVQGLVTVVGGEDVTVEAGTTLSLNLSNALQQTETVALLVQAGQPLAVSAVLTIGSDTATVPGVPAGQLVRPDLAGAVDGPAQLVLANSAETDAQVILTTTPAAGEMTVQTLVLGPGESTVVAVGPGRQALQLHVTPGVAAALVVQPGGDLANGTSVVPIPPDSAWQGITPLWVEAQPAG